MKIYRIVTVLTTSVLFCFTVSTVADGEQLTGVNLVQSDWFSAGAKIQDLRERSTKMFELLDADQSGSITLDEIDLTQMESEVEGMSPEELRQYSRRTSAIHSKFMSWSQDVDEFAVVDTNNDGVWNKDEYDVRYQNLQTHRLELGLQEWDVDGNSAVELHEFNSHLDELELLDENADGTVSHEEAFKSKNNKVISDVLKNKLMIDEMVWASYKTGVGGTTGSSVEVKVLTAPEVEYSK